MHRVFFFYKTRKELPMLSLLEIKAMNLKKVIFFFIILSAKIQAHDPVFHVFGDSHCSEFWNIPGCHSHHVGAVTMHRVGRDSLSILNFSENGVQEGQIVVLTFGEIDVRCHIGKQRDCFGRSLDEILETLTHNYFNTIILNLAQYQKLTCVIYSVTPPLDYYHPSYPPHGTLEDRVIITKLFNQKLADLCVNYGFEFLDVYEEYAAADGTLRREVSDGVHILYPHTQAIHEKLYEIVNKYIE